MIPVNPADGARAGAGLLLAALSLLSWDVAARAAEVPPPVRISEVFYHPASEDSREEFIELWNLGSTNVSLQGWQFTGGVKFVFTNDVVLLPGEFLVVAADLEVFAGRHPEVANVVGGWQGLLSNSRDDIDLDDAAGVRVDSVAYADEGDWARRWRGPLDHNHQGLVWDDYHDGQERSLEWIQPALSNNHGQNWAASATPGGTPGAANSVASANVAPLILKAEHSPPVPRSIDAVAIRVRLLDESPTGARANLFWRVDAASPAAFESLSMWDDGQHEDGLVGDQVFAAILPPQADGTIVEWYVEARDAEDQVRSWPSPVLEEGLSLAQSANGLYQVDDTPVNTAQPLYKIILRENDAAELYQIGHSSNGEQNTDAQFNATFVSIDGMGVECRYLVGVRNRGHGSRNRQPNNYRVNFRSDDPWNGVTALNLNGQSTFLQHAGSALCLLAGLPAAESRAVQLRVNNANLGDNGPHTYGTTYVAVEVMNSDYAAHRFPSDSSGNVYRAYRDIAPSDFAWRGEDANAYRNTWFKSTNNSEDDWSDLQGMLRVLGTNDLYGVATAREVADVDQWLRYLAVMAICDNRETSPNTGHNDDYYLYAGVTDRRFVMIPYDLDSILGRGNPASSVSGTVLGATILPAFQQLLATPEFEVAYYQTLRRLLDTTFAKEHFDAVLEQRLSGFVPAQTIGVMRDWMDGRRAYVRSVLPSDLPPDPVSLTVVLEGVPRELTPLTGAVIQVGGDAVTQYRYGLDGGDWSAGQPVSVSLSLEGLAAGEHVLRVLGGTEDGRWQADAAATTVAWFVDPGASGIRLQEILARNTSAVNHEGTFPDFIELYNEGDGAASLAGLRLTDDPMVPDKFVFPAGVVLESGEFLVVYANNPDGTTGWHTGFSLNADGEGAYVFDAMERGGALLDSVEFGLQLADRSVGRASGREWHLGIPSPGGPNNSIALGGPFGLRINEWLADGRVLYRDDFVELFNPSQQPVALGGLWLTDNITSALDRHVIAPLSFVGPRACTVFWADGETGKGADHLGFKMASEQGELGLFTGRGEPIDRVLYGSQRTDVSQGRRPSGAIAVSDFLVPTPGGLNPGAAPEVTTEVIPLVALTHAWRFNGNEDLTGTGWETPVYDDAGWEEGEALLYVEDAALDGPKSTLLAAVRPTVYFRTTFSYAGPLEALRLEYQAFVDDGAVLYLNGQEVDRLRMDPTGPIGFETETIDTVGNASLDPARILNPDALVVGVNTLAVEVHQAAPDSTDVVFGLILQAMMTRTNQTEMPIVLNELVAAGQPLTLAEGSGDWVELYNASSQPVGLDGLSLTDDPTDATRFVFTGGLVLGPGERLQLACNDRAPASPGNTGFALSRAGDALYLFRAQAEGGELIDSVVFGLQAEGYSLSRVPDGHGLWQLGLLTPEGPNLAAAVADLEGVRINEWSGNPESGEDWFELVNTLGQPVALGGCSLTDDLLNRQQSSIPPLSFLGAGVSAHTVFIADDQPGQGADHVRFQLNALGDTLALFGPDERLIDRVTFGAQSVGVTEGRFPDGADSRALFPASSSRGEPNWLPLPRLQINEVLAHTDPPWEDAVEFWNSGSSPVDLGGWFLSNSRSDLRRYRIPEGTIVPGGGYAVLYESGFGDPESLTAFTFNSARGDQAVLSAADALGGLTGFRAVVDFGASANPVSFGRYVTSVGTDFVPMSRLSFGADAPASVSDFRQGTGLPNPAPLIGPVVISELMVQPPPFEGTNDNVLHEYVELQNLLATTQPLHDPSLPANTWQLNGAVHYAFPPATELAPGEVVLVVSFDPETNGPALAAFRSRYSSAASVRLFGPYQGQLSNAGETLRLLKPDSPQLAPHPDAGLVPEVLVEAVTYRQGAPWPTDVAGTGLSWQRLEAGLYGNEPLHWVAAAPGPGLSAPVSEDPDADADGLPDAWELRYWQSTEDPDAAPEVDPDGDGLTNLEEYLGGSSPLTLKLDPHVVWSETERVLWFLAVQGHSYTVQFRSGLDGNDWQMLQQVETTAASGWQSVTDPGPADEVRFYRVLTRE